MKWHEHITERLLARWRSWRNRPKAIKEAIDDDALEPTEKAAIYLAMLSSSLQVAIWYLLDLPAEIAPPAWVLTVLQYLAIGIAIAAGLSLDYVVVTTTMGRRRGRSSVWSWLTMIAATGFAAMIAYDLYTPGSVFGALPHIAYPVVVFLFGAHLASGRHRLIEPVVAGLERQLTDLAAERDRLLTERDRALADVQRNVTALPHPVTEEVIKVIVKEFTWPEFERLVTDLAGEMAERRISGSTIRRRVKALAGVVTGEA